MRKVIINRKLEYRPSQMPAQDQNDARRIEWNLILDPQHPERQDCLDSANWLNAVRQAHGDEHALSVWQFRGYQCYLPPSWWNPWNAPITGPHWVKETFPTADESDSPDNLLESIDWFYGFLSASGYEPKPLHRHLMPYLNYYTHGDGKFGLDPHQYRPWSYYMQWDHPVWQRRLCDYLVEFAKWAEHQIAGPQALMLGALKGYQVWPVEAKQVRIYDKRDRYPEGHAGVPMIWWFKHYNKKPGDWMGTGGKHVPAYPETTFMGWWYGICNLPAELRWRLDQAGLENWKIIIDWQDGNAFGGYFYLREYLQSEEHAIAYCCQHAIKAAAYCDHIIWPGGNDSDAWFVQKGREWVLDMRANCEARGVEFIEQEKW